MTTTQATEIATADDIRRLDDVVRAFLGSQLADNSLRGYRSDMRRFVAFCAQAGIEISPQQPAMPETVARFLSWCAVQGDSASTIERRRAAIRWAHDATGQPSPTNHPLVRQTMRGIMRKVGRKQAKKAPILDRDLVAMLEHTDRSTLAGLRDYALMVVAFSGALRRSELVAIQVEHLQFRPQGVELTIPKSKTDQEGRGQTVALLDGRRIRPSEALRAWLSASGITAGPVFRSMYRNDKPRASAMTAHAAAELIKRYAGLVGLDVAQIGGHSMRAGFVTSAIMGGANIMKVMDVSRHKKVDTMRGYVRIAEQFNDHAGAGWM